MDSGFCIIGDVASWPGTIAADEIRLTSKSASDDNRIEVESNAGDPTCASKCTSPNGRCILTNASGFKFCLGTTEVGSFP
jgi:hypothetical protein